MYYEIVSVRDLTPGAPVDLHWPDGSGYGGIVVAVGESALTVKHPLETREWPLADFDAGDMTVMVRRAHQLDDCVDYRHPGLDCNGSVEYRAVGEGTPVLRCEAHFAQRERRYRTSLERYAGSATPPPGFREDDAGERWSEDY